MAVDVDLRGGGILHGEFHLIPPEPKLPVEKAGCEKHGGGNTEAFQYRSRKLRKIAITIIDGNGDGLGRPMDWPQHPLELARGLLGTDVGERRADR